MVAVDWFYLKKPPQPFHGVIRGTHFMTLWFAGLLVSGGALVRHGLTHGFGHDLGGTSDAGVGSALAGVGGMALFGYLLMSAGFWSEVKKLRVLLREQIGHDPDAKQGR
jgi:hypothetical protein